MTVKYHNYAIHIIPDNAQDEVYLETVLGLKNKDDKAIAKRIAPMGLAHSWAYVELRKEVGK